MKTQLFTAISVLMVLTLLLPAAEMPAIAQGHSAVSVVPASDHMQAAVELQDTPLMFIENVGQFDPDARFQVHGDNATIYLTGNVIWSAVLEDSPASHPVSPQEGEVPTPTPEPGQVISGDDQSHLGVNIKYSFVGANSNPQLDPFNRLDTVVSYFIGDDPAGWQPDVPAWGGVRYRNLYPGVDLEMTGESGQWIWRLVTQEAASLGAVQLHVEGMDDLAIDGSGRLRIETAVGNIPGPVVLADLGDSMTATADDNVVMQAVVAGDTVRFVPSTASSASPIKSADTQTELAYSTLLGGSGFDAGNAIAAGSGGIAYVTGETYSTGFPTTPGAFDPTLNGNRDIFVTKIQSNGNALAFSTFVGGSSDDQAYAISTDAAGAVYLVGSSFSSNFPTTAGAFDTTYNGSADVVVAKLNATGNGLLYSTYLGGSSAEVGDGLAVDTSGAAFIAGYTASPGFPTTPGAFDTTWNGGSPYSEAFVIKLNSAGSALLYSTFLGGTSEDDANDIAVDSVGAAYVTGWTNSSNFPTTPGAFDRTLAGHNDAFITKLNTAGNGLIYSGLLGGSGDDQGQGIAVDAYGAAYITGQTTSSNFTVTPGAYDTSLGGFWDGFVAKVSSGGNTLIYSTFVGGGQNDCETVGIDRECVIAVDASGVTYIAGRTFSADFPTTPNGFDTSYNGNEDGFMARLKPDGGSLIYGSFFGGTSSDQTLAVAVDTAGAAYVSGRTYSSNFPASAGAFDTTYNGGADAFAIKLLVGGYTSGPIADPNRSTISVQPAVLPADGVTAATITVQLLTASGQPAWGKTVLLSSSRGALDSVIQPTNATGSDGRTTGTILSSTTGLSNISAWVLDDGVPLASTAGIVFGEYTPPDGAFRFQLDYCVDKVASDSLRWIDEDAHAIADDGTYFRGAIGEDAAKLVTDVVFGVADLIGGINQTAQLQKAARLYCPGCYIPGTWNVRYSDSHPYAAQLLDFSTSDIAELIGWNGPKFLSWALNWGATEVTKETAKFTTQLVFAAQDDGMTTVMYPTIHSTSNELSVLLREQRDDLLANWPGMPWAYQNAYEGDLIGRAGALRVLGEQLDDERVTLANFRQSREESQQREQTLWYLRLGADVLTALSPGVSTLIKGSVLVPFDAHMDKSQLDESMFAYMLAVDSLLGAPTVLRQISGDACALERMARGLPADRATGQILGVTHYSQGSTWWEFWKETASWSDVSVVNTGNSEATFLVMASYLVDTERFGVPWATMKRVAEGETTLSPGASGTVRVDYKRADGTKGFSPRSETCLPIAGCVPASDVEMEILGINDAGVYYIGRDRSKWQPISPTAGLSALATVDSPIIDPPLTTYVLSAPWTQRHEAQLWINNPFTSTIPVTVTQTLPPDINLLDAGGASQSGDTLIWNTVVEPSALNVVTFTFSFPAVPGTENSLPPAILSLVNPLDGQPLSANSNVATFWAIWPLTLDYATPGYVLPGSSSQAVITVTNWLSDSVISGTLDISVTDAQSATLHTESKPFSVVANGTGAVTFTLPALLRGDYLVHGEVSASGASEEAFADPLQVGLLGPPLDYRVSPQAVVHPNNTLIYTLRFNNTVGVPLSGAMITASLPASVTVMAGSVTGGGVVEPDQVRWTLDTVGVDQLVEQSFAVRVNANAVPPAPEPGRLLSEPLLTANEIVPTWGPLAWNSVAYGIYLPVILKNK